MGNMEVLSNYGPSTKIFVSWWVEVYKSFKANTVFTRDEIKF